MSIKLDIKLQTQLIDQVFDESSDATFHDIIKRVETTHPLPKFKEAYYHFIDFEPEEYGDILKAYDNACLLRDVLIQRLAEEFVEMHARESRAYWALPVKELDYSLDSIKLIDEKNMYSGAFTQSYCTKNILPLLAGYLIHTILKNTTQHGWEVRYTNNLYKTTFKPSAGAQTITPFDYIKMCLFSGFKFSELYHCLISITEGLANNYGIWRRQYLSDESKP